MKWAVFCAISLIALASVVSGETSVATNSNLYYYHNPGCLGEPYQVSTWQPIVPTGHNCSQVDSTNSVSTQWWTSQQECPTAPGTAWTTHVFFQAGCNTTMYSQPDLLTEKCISFAFKRDEQGGADQSYYLSCLGDYPIQPYVKVEVIRCQSSPAPSPPPGVLSAAPVPSSVAFFANTPGACLPYYNNTDYSSLSHYAVYVKTSEICDTNLSTSLNLAFYNDSTCDFLLADSTVSVGADSCTQIPGTSDSYVVTCFGTRPPSGSPPTAPSPSSPSGSPHTTPSSDAVASSTLSLVLVFILALAASLTL